MIRATRVLACLVNWLHLWMLAVATRWRWRNWEPPNEGYVRYEYGRYREGRDE